MRLIEDGRGKRTLAFLKSQKKRIAFWGLRVSNKLSGFRGVAEITQSVTSAKDEKWHKPFIPQYEWIAKRHGQIDPLFDTQGGGGVAHFDIS